MVVVNVDERGKLVGCLDVRGIVGSRSRATTIRVQFVMLVFPTIVSGTIRISIKVFHQGELKISTYCIVCVTGMMWVLVAPLIHCHAHRYGIGFRYPGVFPRPRGI